MKKYIYLLIFISAFSLESHAAKNLLVFKNATATYTELTGATSVTFAVLTYDSFLVNDVIGETFSFFGKPMVMQQGSIMISKNARIQLTEDTAFSVIDALYNDSLSAIDANTSVSYKIEGQGNDKILKVQWKNMMVKTGPAGNFINVQTWIYKSGIIEFHYGPRSANNASGYTDPVTGLYIGVWYSNFDFSKVYEKMQVVGTVPNFTIDSVLNLNVPNIEGAPQEGTVFRFIPKGVAAGISDVGENMNISVSPNPAVGRLVVELAEYNGPVRLVLTDIMGQVRYSGNITGKTHVIDTQCLPPGLYNVLVQERGQTITRRVQVLH